MKQGEIVNTTMRAPGPKKFWLMLSAIGLVLALSGCGGSTRITTSSAEAAYRRGAELFERGRYSRAIEQLQAVFDFGRGHEYAADAQLMLAESYFHDEQYLLAANEFDRFIQLYRGDPRVAGAEFSRARCYYELSPPYELDQKDTEQAITYLRLFINRFPTHENVEQAGRMIVELQEKLAHKLYRGAELYERQRQFEAGALTYQRVLDEYSNTSWAPLAMWGEIRAYVLFADNSVPARQPERLDRAIQVYERMAQIFPDHPAVQEARGLYEQAVARRRAFDDTASGAGDEPPG